MLIGILVGLFLLFVFVGMPVAHAMLPAIFITLILGFNVPLTVVASAIVTAIDKWIWLAFPLFLMLGNVMNVTGIAHALVDVSLAVFGRIHGALSHVSVASNILMAGLSGSCSADAAATGTILIPAMEKAHYSKGYASMIICSSSLIGSLIPPSIILIITAVLGQMSVLRLWLGGAVPGVILGLGLLITGYIMAQRRGFPREEQLFSFKRAGVTTLKASPALVLPVVILGGMRVGVFTPTEAGAVAVVYALLVGGFFYKKLTFKKFREAASVTVKLLGPLMWMVGIGIAYGQVLARLKIGESLVDFMTGITHDALVFQILISLMLILFGMLMEATPVQVIFYPLLYPVANAYGLDPVHFGVLFTYGILVGQSTPPVGPTMFISNAIAKCSVGEYIKDGWPLLMTQFAVIPILILLPSSITWLPNLVMGPTQ